MGGGVRGNGRRGRGRGGEGRLKHPTTVVKDNSEGQCFLACRNVVIDVYGEGGGEGGGYWPRVRESRPNHKKLKYQ